jgi:hypothetical protein
MSDDVDVLRRLNAQEQKLGQVYDQIACTYVPLTATLFEAGGLLAGAALNVGVYSIGPVGGGATYSFAYPTTAKAVMVKLQATWAAAAAGSVAYCIYTGGASTESGVIAAGMVANISDRKSGIVSLDASSKLSLVVAGANTTALNLAILGYFL